MGKTICKIINQDLTLRLSANISNLCLLFGYFKCILKIDKNIFYYKIYNIKDSFACLFIIQLPKDLYKQIIFKSCIKMNQKYPKYKDAKLSN